MVDGNRCLIFISMMSCRILIFIALHLPCLAPAQTGPAAQPGRTSHPELTSLPSPTNRPGPPDQPAPPGLLSVASRDQPGSLPILAGGRQAVIYTDTADAKVVSLATTALADDIAGITGKRLTIRHNAEPTGDYIIIIGTLGRSRLLDSLLAKSSRPPRPAATILPKSPRPSPTATSPLLPATDASQLAGKWESYQLTLIDRPFPNVKKALVIAGSDPRGTAYGIFELSRLLGVSPGNGGRMRIRQPVAACTSVPDVPSRPLPRSDTGEYF